MNFISKNPLTTLLSTSEGLAFLLYLIMTCIGMLNEEVPFKEGLMLIGGGFGVWSGSRAIVKKNKANPEMLEAKDELQDILKILKEKNGHA